MSQYKPTNLPYSVLKNNTVDYDILPSKNRENPGKFRIYWIIYIDILSHFHFLADKITEKDINSNIPFFNCTEIGHESNLLDSVCLESTCTYKGLTCCRCLYMKHA